MKDLAEQLGVSIATVSRALRNSHEVGDEMKQKVQALAKELNYRPNPFAQGLRSEAPKMIGVVLPNLVTHFNAAVLDGIEEYATKEGYSVSIIACLAQDTVDYKHFEVINEMGIPLVFYARTCMQDRFSCVTGNGDEAAQEATQHLIDTGSRRIAFLGGPNHLDMVQRRKHGYLEALRENKIAIDRSLVVSGKMDFAEAREAALRLLDREDRPDAILAVNDTVTFAVFDAIKTRHLRIPQDVAIIGFTENDASAFVTPKLTVIKDQAHQLGEKACELLLRRIKGDSRIYREIIPMTLEIRESSDKKKLL